MKAFKLIPILVLASGVLIAMATSDTVFFVPMIILWVVSANLAYSKLRCVKCGKKLMTTRSGFVRGTGINKCDHCGHLN